MNKHEGDEKRNIESRTVASLSLSLSHHLAFLSEHGNRQSDDPRRRTRTRTSDARHSQTRNRVPVARVRVNCSSCPRDSPRTVLSPQTLAPRRARETAGTSWPVNCAALDPVVRVKPPLRGISRRLVIDGRAPT